MNADDLARQHSDRIHAMPQAWKDRFLETLDRSTVALARVREVDALLETLTAERRDLWQQFRTTQVDLNVLFREAGVELPPRGELDED